MIHVTYGSSCKADPIGWHVRTPRRCWRGLMLAEMVREASGHSEGGDLKHAHADIQARLKKPPKTWATTATCLALVQAALRGRPTRLVAT